MLQHVPLSRLHANTDRRGRCLQDARLQKKSSLEAAQKEAAQLQKEVTDLKADLQSAESTVEVSIQNPVTCVPLLCASAVLPDPHKSMFCSQMLREVNIAMHASE